MKFAFNIDPHQFGFGLHQTLCSHHHFHFTGADAECDGSECAVGGRMAVATNNGHSRLCETQFGSDHMHNSLVGMSQAIKFNAKFFAVFVQCLNLQP